MLSEMEREPEECESYTIESHICRHGTGVPTAFVVHLRRVDGATMPIHCATLAEVIELVRCMQPEHVTIRAAGAARRVLFDAFIDAVDEIENDSIPPTPPTLH